VLLALLEHHREVCLPRAGGEITDSVVAECTLTFDELRERAGISGLAGGLGRHLRRVAIWCRAEGFPPLHALAVKNRTADPSDGYEQSPGLPGDWREDVRRAITFASYRF
jgi:hypothetical protein